jgi:dihydroorotase-like cyclic amidohydrolase
MRNKATPLIEYVSESAAACLFTMVQGNLLAITASHLLIASQTGLVAGTIATVGIFASRTRNRWLIAAALGVTTAVVDFHVHPGMFGSVATEAVVTGLAAAVLSFLTGVAMRRFRANPADAS